MKPGSKRDPLKPVPPQDIRLPPKPQRSRGFEYESPRSPELSEEMPGLIRANTDVPKGTKANPLPGTLRKDLKNPLTNGRMGGTTFVGEQGMMTTVRETNDELRRKVGKMEDEIRKWRRLRVLTLEKEKQIEQLQLSIKLAEQEKAELQHSIQTPCRRDLSPHGFHPLCHAPTSHWVEIQSQMDSLRLRLGSFLGAKPM